MDINPALGRLVSKGEALYRIHAQFKADFRFARNMAKKDKGYQIGRKDEILAPLLDA